MVIGFIIGPLALPEGHKTSTLSFCPGVRLAIRFSIRPFVRVSVMLFHRLEVRV